MILNIQLEMFVQVDEYLEMFVQEERESQGGGAIALTSGQSGQSDVKSGQSISSTNKKTFAPL